MAHLTQIHVRPKNKSRKGENIVRKGVSWTTRVKSVELPWAHKKTNGPRQQYCEGGIWRRLYGAETDEGRGVATPV